MTRNKNMVWTEDDLRAVLRSLEQHAPTLDSVLATLEEGGARCRSSRTRHPRRQGRQWRITATTGVAGLMALAVAVALATATGVTGGRAPSENVVELRNAMLTAFSRTSGDILYVHETTTSSKVANYPPGKQIRELRSWYAPWQPLPGQQGRGRVVQIENGKVASDSRLTYTMPRHAVSSTKLIVPWYVGLPVPTVNWQDGRKDAHEVAVDYRSRTMLLESGHVMSIVDYAAVLRAEFAKGQWRIGRHAIVDGQRAVELIWRTQQQLMRVAVDLWVSARTHLPVRLVSVVTFTGKRSRTEATSHATIRVNASYEFLAPTAANLAKLRVPVPKGFRCIRTAIRDSQQTYSRCPSSTTTHASVPAKQGTNTVKRHNS
jgi:hypothetical protein